MSLVIISSLEIDETASPRPGAGHTSARLVSPECLREYDVSQPGGISNLAWTDDEVFHDISECPGFEPFQHTIDNALRCGDLVGEFAGVVWLGHMAFKSGSYTSNRVRWSVRGFMGEPPDQYLDK